MLAGLTTYQPSVAKAQEKGALLVGGINRQQCKHQYVIIEAPIPIFLFWPCCSMYVSSLEPDYSDVSLRNKALSSLAS